MCTLLTHACRPAATFLTSFENRRTLEGFDASLTAKKAALQFLFTFAPKAYVGLAGEPPLSNSCSSHHSWSPEVHSAVLPPPTALQ